MFDIVINLSLLIVAISTILFVYRLVKGPTTPDRVIALDAIGINLIAITAIISIAIDSKSFVEIILLIGILAFIGTVAFSKWLEKGEIIENDRNR
jgi:multicomponent Na+:H+ antiporter subunit F